MFIEGAPFRFRFQVKKFLLYCVHPLSLLMAGVSKKGGTERILNRIKTVL